MKNKFLVFSVYRAVLFTGLAATLVFFGIFGPVLWRFYFGGGTFHYDTGALAVHYLDVGQGDSMVIQLPDGRIIVMDSGEAIYYPRVKNYLETRILTGGSRKIDFLIATHSHSDHVGGFAQMLQDFNVGMVYRPYNKSLADPAGDAAVGPLANTAEYNSFIDAAYKYAGSVEFVRSGEEIFAGISGTGNKLYSFYFHTPTPEFAKSLKPSEFNDYNDISPIITLTYFNQTFVFTGDAGFNTEKQFLAEIGTTSLADSNFSESYSTVYLKVGHHGSNAASSLEFLNFVKPAKAVISLGAHNIYGFPDAQVMNRLGEVSLNPSDIMLTSKLGNIVIESGAGAEPKIYLAFDNEADLSLIWYLGFVFVFTVCFVDFRRKIS